MPYIHNLWKENQCQSCSPKIHPDEHFIEVETWMFLWRVVLMKKKGLKRWRGRCWTLVSTSQTLWRSSSTTSTGPAEWTKREGSSWETGALGVRFFTISILVLLSQICERRILEYKELRHGLPPLQSGRRAGRLRQLKSSVQLSLQVNLANPFCIEEGNALRARLVKKKPRNKEGANKVYNFWYWSSFL